jgi:hypothetical protein
MVRKVAVLAMSACELIAAQAEPACNGILARKLTGVFVIVLVVPLGNLPAGGASYALVGADVVERHIEVLGPIRQTDHERMQRKT